MMKKSGDFGYARRANWIDVLYQTTQSSGMNRALAMLGGGKGTPVISDTNSRAEPSVPTLNVLLVKAATAAFSIESVRL